MTAPQTTDTTAEYRIPSATHVGHVHLRVANLERAIDFYCGILGFKINQDMRTDPIPRRVALVSASDVMGAGAGRGGARLDHARTVRSAGRARKRGLTRPLDRGGPGHDAGGMLQEVTQREIERIFAVMSAPLSAVRLVAPETTTSPSRRMLPSVLVRARLPVTESVFALGRTMSLVSVRSRL